MRLVNISIDIAIANANTTTASSVITINAPNLFTLIITSCNENIAVTFQ